MARPAEEMRALRALRKDGENTPPPKNAPRREIKSPTSILKGGQNTSSKTPYDSGVGAMMRHKAETTAWQRRKGIHEPTPELQMAVERAVGLGLTQEQISHLCGMSVGTLNKHYKFEMRNGGATLHSAIAANLAAIALDKDDKRCVEAAKFILARKFGWVEKVQADLSATVNVQQNVIDARVLAPEDRDSLRGLLMQALTSQPALEDRTVEGEFVEVDDVEDLL